MIRAASEYICFCIGLASHHRYFTVSTVLMDDGKHTSPTYANIMRAYKKLVQEAQPGDAVFCHYSGENRRVLIMSEFPNIDLIELFFQAMGGRYETTTAMKRMDMMRLWFHWIMTPLVKFVMTTFTRPSFVV